MDNQDSGVAKVPLTDSQLSRNIELTVYNGMEGCTLETVDY